jgi:hypothetical protein
MHPRAFPFRGHTEIGTANMDGVLLLESPDARQGRETRPVGEMIGTQYANVQAKS